MVRKARRSDVEAIAEIYSSAYRELGKEDSEWFKAVIGLKSRRIVVLVAELNGEIAGFILTYRNKNRAYIDSLAVSKEFRKMGIGGLLLSDVERLLSNRGVKSLYLSVKSWNTNALNFYLKRGYGIRGVVLLMSAKPQEISAHSVSSTHTIADVSASKIRTRISRPLATWSNFVDDVDKFIYRKLYREERALIVKRNRSVKALVTYSVNHELVVDSITLSSYSALEALEIALHSLRSIALANKASIVEIPVDASKRKLVALLERMGFKVSESEYLLYKSLE